MEASTDFQVVPADVPNWKLEVHGPSYTTSHCFRRRTNYLHVKQFKGKGASVQIAELLSAEHNVPFVSNQSVWAHTSYIYVYL